MVPCALGCQLHLYTAVFRAEGPIAPFIVELMLWSCTAEIIRANHARCSKSPFSKAEDESKLEAYPQGYVEDFDESRTKLAAFFSILPGASLLVPEHGQRPLAENPVGAGKPHDQREHHSEDEADA